MRFEPFAGFRLSFGLLLPLLVVSVALEVWMFKARRRGWTPLIWLPLATASGAMALSLVGALLERSGSGPEGGFHAMGKMFALMCGWPVFVIFAGALWAFPRRWCILPTVGGIIATGTAATVPFYVTTKPVTVQVLSAGGRPIPGVSLKGETTRDGRAVKLGRFTSDERGCFRFRFSADNRIRFSVGTSDDFYSTQLEVAAAEDRMSQPAPAELRLMYWWGLPGTSELSQGCSLAMQRDESTIVPFFLRPKEPLVFQPLQDRIRDLIEEAQLTGAHADVLENACRNVESLELIDKVAALIPAQPRLHDAAIGGLRYAAEMLAELQDLHRSLSRKAQISRWDHKDKRSFAALCDMGGRQRHRHPCRSDTCDPGKAEGLRRHPYRALPPILDRREPFPRCVGPTRNFGQTCDSHDPSGVAASTPESAQGNAACATAFLA